MHPLPLEAAIAVLQDSPPGNVWLHQLHHVQRSLVQSDKRGVVDLSKTKKLKDLLHPRTHSIDTASNNGAK